MKSVALLVSLLSLASSINAYHPQTIKLESRAHKQVHTSRWNTRSSNQSHVAGVPLTDWIANTDLQWYSTVEVGTPPQKFTVMFDTGSTALVLPATGCTTCGNHTLFDAAQSTSFSSLPGEDVIRAFSTGATSVPIVNDEEANCTIVTDVVTLDGLTSAEQMFALCSQYPGAFADVPMDGILGMGISSQLAEDPMISSFWNWYGSGLLPEPVFSFYLIPGSATGAELTLGGIDHSKYRGELAYIHLNRNVSALSEAFVVDLVTLYINDEEVLVTGNSSTGLCGQPAPFQAGLAALDTGTAFLQTPDKVSAADIYAQISPLITQIDAAGAWGAPCPVLDAVAPKLTFAISSGDMVYYLTLPRKFFNLGEYPGQPGVCQAAFNNPVESIADPTGEGRPVWILGSPFLKAYYTIWDGLNLKVGFAEAVSVRRRAFYGRYFPQPDDFKPDPQHINSTSSESLAYWASVLESRCDASVRIYEDTDGGRDVFALGSVIIKSSHLKPRPEGGRADRDYSYADANEVAATALARGVLASTSVKVPRVYFASKINGRDVLVQERIPGVGLNIAWQYISQSQKGSFKQQARSILQLLNTLKPPSSSSSSSSRSYIVPDPDPVSHRGIQELEKEIIFSSSTADDNDDDDLGFMHNDFSLSNCIVDNDRIVGLVDWEMAGYFGWRIAGAVHVQIRTPKRENFAALDLPEEVLSDILFWNDLYEKDFLI